MNNTKSLPAAPKPRRTDIRSLTMISLMAALSALCSWLTVPAAVPITMQTFAVFCTAQLLGARDGTLSVALYILLGAVGLPVFAGFNSGFVALLGPTGGYILGFLLMPVTYATVRRLCGDRRFARAAALAASLAVCYAFGTAWFSVVYTRNVSPVSFVGALGMCVAPFVIPDALKAALSALLCSRVEKYLAARH